MATVEGLQQDFFRCHSKSQHFHEQLSVHAFINRANRNRQKELRPFINFVMLLREFCSSLTWLREIWIYLMLTGQYDPPDDPMEYIRRIGRTARGDDSSGHALLILRPEELGFLHYLEIAHVSINEYKFSWNKIAAIQLQLEKLISKNYFLHQLVKEAFKNNVRAYYSHHLKLFDIETLDLPKFAKSFGFTVPSAMDLKVEISKSSRPQKRLGGGSLRTFQKYKRPEFDKAAETHQDLSPDRQTWAG
ncbi:PREDICTED: probable ATP-dependent RNA helicase pitchoune [Trachymyrmex cornetzi]|uniref:probable ATP-dependent RNA helicase pitchoune n=1 Tax=Trachymyrmex cornetzi TaxID=471704 RepID=UPI00084F6A5B|nr:PREDICTED: probable ATP-dependent RNA helicase pitchoune [Trachymyrmex cornetzi]